MRNSVAKQIRKDVYILMQYDAATDYKIVRTTPKFKAMYRKRKKMYMKGLVGVSRSIHNNFLPDPNVAS